MASIGILSLSPFKIYYNKGTEYNIYHKLYKCNGFIKKCFKYSLLIKQTVKKINKSRVIL